MVPTHDAAIGVDLGGTKTAAALVGADGAVLWRLSTSTPARQGPAAILDAVAFLAERLAAEARSRSLALAGLGLGSAGVIDPATCQVVSATDVLTGWAGTDLRAGLLERLGGAGGAVGRVEAVNDVHAHALGEAWLGAARGTSTALLVAFGTGIGGSFLVDGRPVSGARSVAGHFGHVPSAAAGGLVCTCGAMGHLEAIASGPALHRFYQRLGGDPRAADTRAVFERARAGEAPAVGAIRRAARAAGSALGGFANSLDPEALVLSGGLADAGPLWWDAVRESFAEELVPALRHVEPVPALLGGDAATIGAASLVLRPPAASVPAGPSGQSAQPATPGQSSPSVQFQGASRVADR